VYVGKLQSFTHSAPNPIKAAACSGLYRSRVSPSTSSIDWFFSASKLVLGPHIGIDRERRLRYLDFLPNRDAYHRHVRRAGSKINFKGVRT
jgi:hypothetical protein